MTQQPNTRDDAIDNAKFVAIVLVVLGHLMEPLLPGRPVISAIWLSIYSFHMPVFVILAGWLTKPVADIPEHVAKIVSTLVAPLVAFTIIYEGYHILLFGSVSHYTVNWQPCWILWFLWSLLCWRLLFPVIMSTRLPLLWVTLFALAAGYRPEIGYFLGGARTIYYLPFFILGHQLGQSPGTRALIRAVPQAVWMAVLLGNIGLFTFLRELPHQWLYGSFSYSALHATGWSAAPARIGIFGVSALTAFAVIRLMPQRTMSISARGANSLYVFVWHGLLVWTLEGTGILASVGRLPDVAAVLVLTLAALTITVLFSSPVVATLTQRYVIAPTKRSLFID